MNTDILVNVQQLTLEGAWFVALDNFRRVNTAKMSKVKLPKCRLLNIVLGRIVHSWLSGAHISWLQHTMEMNHDGDEEIITLFLYTGKV